MRLWLAAGIVCALASTAQARGRKCHGDCPPFGWEGELDVGTQQLSLAHETFSNTFVPVDSQRHPLPAETVRVTGRNIGADRPWLIVADIHYQYTFVPHLTVGPRLGFIGGDVGKTVQADGGVQVSGQGASGIIIGPELRGIFAFGPLELRGGVSFGYRELDLTVLNRWTYCKGGICNAHVGDGAFFFEPRVSVAYNFRAVAVGGYFGGDVMPSGGISAGGFLAVRLGDWDALANAHHWSRAALYH